jgi:hypothetical protein
MKLAILLCTLILASCKGGGGGGGSGSSSCSPSKSIFSTWTSRERDNPVYLMQSCSYNRNCQVLFGSAPCNDSRGDFTVFISNNGTMGFSNCADTIGLDSATWSIGCDNLLRIRYSSDNSTEVFE